MAHHDGQYFAAPGTLAELHQRDQIAFRYCGKSAGADNPQFSPPFNPNGSIDDIAGIFNDRKTVLGLMPHPERAADPLHGGTDGCGLLDSLVAALS